MATTDNRYTYFAFISYNSKDTAWGKRLQRKLETYRIPATLCRERDLKRKPLKPIFFAPTDIQPGGLSAELKNRLKASKHLIVICSPNSAKSEWVGEEIRYFHELGRDENIHFFIIDGSPNSNDPATECFNPVVKELGLPEILGANIHEKIYRLPMLNRQRAYIQLISKLLGVEFDSIWKRHVRRMISGIVIWTLVVIAVITTMLMIWINSRPFDAALRLEESSVHNSALPPLHNAVVTMTLDNETKTDTVASASDVVNFRNLPHKYLGQQVRFTVSCPDFIPVDTVVTLTRDVTLYIHRDAKVYGDIRKQLWDWKKERGVAGMKVMIENREAISDNEGNISLSIPLAEQKEYYIIEIPSRNFRDTVFMPCEEGQIIDLEP